MNVNRAVRQNFGMRVLASGWGPLFFVYHNRKIPAFLFCIVVIPDETAAYETTSFLPKVQHLWYIVIYSAWSMARLHVPPVSCGSLLVRTNATSVVYPRFEKSSKIRGVVCLSVTQVNGLIFSSACLHRYSTALYPNFCLHSLLR